MYAYIKFVSDLTNDFYLFVYLVYDVCTKGMSDYKWMKIYALSLRAEDK